LEASGIDRQAAIPPFAFLVFGNPFEQMHAAKLRPQRGRYVNFRVCQLPQEKIAEPHLAAGANN
jgi:hypothetical protein